VNSISREELKTPIHWFKHALDPDLVNWPQFPLKVKLPPCVAYAQRWEPLI